MSQLTVHFEFDIGQIVTHKAMRETCSLAALQPLQIVKRVAEETACGVQSLYGVRAIDRGQSFGIVGSYFCRELFELAEEELVVFPPEATAEALKEKGGA